MMRWDTLCAARALAAPAAANIKSVRDGKVGRKEYHTTTIYITTSCTYTIYRHTDNIKLNALTCVYVLFCMLNYAVTKYRMYHAWEHKIVVIMVILQY